MDLSGLEYGPVAYSYEHGNESLDSTTDEDESLSASQEELCPWNTVFII
jgi:hypothetical protein